MKRRGIRIMLLIGAIGATAQAEPARVDLAFDVLRKDKPMGSHTISVRRDGADLVAEIAIDLKIKFAFVTLFEYAHRNREVWRDNRLVSIDTTTNNDGKLFRIAGRAGADGFHVTDGDGVERVFAPGVLPTSYWHPRTPAATQLLNTQTGELATVSITPAPTAPAAGPGRQYVVSGDLDLNLWYADGCLQKLNFRAPRDNSLIDYRRAAPAAGAAATCPAQLLEPVTVTAAFTENR
ncbi:MAG: DUF6134 family protein [Gammaproteobacteria bacterium]|jgi:hypothetical protein